MEKFALQLEDCWETAGSSLYTVLPHWSRVALVSCISFCRKPELTDLAWDHQLAHKQERKIVWISDGRLGRKFERYVWLLQLQIRMQTLIGHGSMDQTAVCNFPGSANLYTTELSAVGNPGSAPYRVPWSVLKVCTKDELKIMRGKSLVLGTIGLP